jgi:predicted transcriptional regulator
MSFTTPKTRQDIAKELGIDWKEVNRNLHILIKSNLMKIIYENSKTKMYGLTSYGESIVNIIKKHQKSKGKGSYKKTLKMLKRIIIYEKMRNK